jgi:hypothetical protein
MINITLNAETPEQLAADIGWLAQRLGAADIVGQVIERKKAKAATEKAIEKASTKSEPTEAPAEAVIEPAQEKQVSLEEVRAKLKDLGADKLDGVKALITGYGVKGLSAVPADKYPELLEKALAL